MLGVGGAVSVQWLWAHVLQGPFEPWEAITDGHRPVSCCGGLLPPAAGFVAGLGQEVQGDEPPEPKGQGLGALG